LYHYISVNLALEIVHWWVPPGRVKERGDTQPQRHGGSKMRFGYWRRSWTELLGVRLLGSQAVAVDSRQKWN